TVPNFPNGVVDNRVLLVNRFGQIVWQYGQFGQSGIEPNLLNIPVQNTFVPNCSHNLGNNCHYNCSHNNGRNCNRKCKEKRRDNCCVPFDGTILITDQGNQRIIRVDVNKNILWQFPTNAPDFSQ